MQQVGSSSWDGYVARAVTSSSTDSFRIFKVTTNSFTLIASASYEYASGRQLAFGRRGNNLEFWVAAQPGPVWTKVLEVTDTSYMSGKIGITVANGQQSNGRLDDFGGGAGTLPPPASPAPTAYPVVDNFNRPDENPVFQDGKWAASGISGGVALKSYSWLLVPSNSGSAFRTTYFNGSMQAFFSVAGTPGNLSAQYVYVALRDAGTSTFDGYAFVLSVNGTGGQSFVLRRYDNGVPTALASVGTSVSQWGKILLRQLGSTLEGWLYHNGTWTLQLTAVDDAYADGRIGVQMYDAGFGNGGGTIDNFGGGTASSSFEEQALLNQYAPELRFWAEETYRADSAAVGTDLFLERPENHAVELKCCFPVGSGTFASADPNSPLPRLLREYLSSTQPGGGYFLKQPNVWGDAITSAANDYNLWIAANPQQRSIVYGRVVFDPNGSGEKLLQYWMFYYYNPQNWNGAGNHEGDWEWAQVRLTASNVPVSLALSQHGNPERCLWGSDVQLSATGRPVVYVAWKSHAHYFWAGEHDGPFLTTDLTGDFGAGYYEWPTVVNVTNPPGWITWDGHWGGSEGSFGGEGPSASPESPGAQGEQWEDPFAWEGEIACSEPPSFRRQDSDDVKARSRVRVASGHVQTAKAPLRTFFKGFTMQGKPPLPRILSAKPVRSVRYGKAIRVSYCFSALPMDPWKRPWRLNLTVENLRDSLPPLSIAWKVTKRCATVNHPVGAIKAPYLLRYSVESRRGSRSKLAAIRIR